MKPKAQPLQPEGAARSGAFLLRLEQATSPQPSERAWEPPLMFDGYRLVTCIGSGAMETVYLARDVVLDRPAAIKFIDTTDVEAQQYERFVVEARAIARLHHPNVVSIYRIGELQGRPYLASDLSG